MVCSPGPACSIVAKVEIGTVADTLADDGVQDLQRLDRLESLFESIRSAPIQTVDDLVRDIRSAHVGLKNDLVPVGPWEGTEGKEIFIGVGMATHMASVRIISFAQFGRAAESNSTVDQLACRRLQYAAR